jgi:hypothetical protein
MPASPGGILPRDMDARQWNTFLTQSGIQADRTVKTFTPTWGGFSVDPVGVISYMDFGAIVYLWTENDLYGTSNATTFSTQGGMPAEIIPRINTRRVFSPAMLDNGVSAACVVDIQPLSGNMLFRRFDVDGSAGGTDAFPYALAGWTAGGTSKGITSSFIISYVK